MPRGKRIQKCRLDTETARMKFIEGAKRCADNIDHDHHFIRSYPQLLESTKILCDELGDAAIPAVAHLAYGWMPTILKNLNFCKENSRKVFEASSSCSVEDSIQYITGWRTPPINNSWVGSSKVLHFINPETFPIWDSKVAGHFGISGNSARKNTHCYAEYVMFCEDIANTYSEVSNVQLAFEELAGYSVSKIRAVEYILFNSN